MNISRRLRGLSIGIINVADSVEGVQLGVVNVTREVKGASLGVVSVAGNGRIQPTFWTSNLMPAHVGVRFIAGYAYSELGAALNPGDDTHAVEVGGGLHLPLTARLYLEPGVHYSEVQSTQDDDADEHGDLHYRLRAGLRFFDLFDVFAAAVSPTASAVAAVKTPNSKPCSASPRSDPVHFGGWWDRRCHERDARPSASRAQSVTVASRFPHRASHRVVDERPRSRARRRRRAMLQLRSHLNEAVDDRAS